MVIITIIIVTFTITIFARGYIPEYNNGLKIKATGLLSVNSLPKNASVFVNDKLVTTTDSTINLIPNDYQIKIAKEGYLPWNKKITIQKEMVSLAQASLFKTNPRPIPITTGDVLNPTVNPDLNQIIYIAPPSTTSIKPGIYLIEANYYLSLVLNQYQPKFITKNPFSPTDNSIAFTFSPNSKQVILTSSLKKNIYLIDLTTGNIDPLNQPTNLDWYQQTQQIDAINLNKLPKIFLSTIATNPASVQFSSDENKFIYLLNNQYYGYDAEKNLNYLIDNDREIQFPFWLPKSNSIIYVNSGKIKTVEFDGTNKNTIFFSDTLLVKSAIPQFDGTKLTISTTDNIFILTIR